MTSLSGLSFLTVTRGPYHPGKSRRGVVEGPSDLTTLPHPSSARGQEPQTLGKMGTWDDEGRREEVSSSTNSGHPPSLLPPDEIPGKVQG